MAKIEPRNVQIGAPVTKKEKREWQKLASLLGRRPGAMLRDAALEFMSKTHVRPQAK